MRHGSQRKWSVDDVDVVITSYGNVTVRRSVTLGTLDEKIDAILTAKEELAEITVSTGETWLTEMTDRELRELFALTCVI